MTPLDAAKDMLETGLKRYNLDYIYSVEKKDDANGDPYLEIMDASGDGFTMDYNEDDGLCIVPASEYFDDYKNKYEIAPFDIFEEDQVKIMQICLEIVKTINQFN